MTLSSRAFGKVTAAIAPLARFRAGRHAQRGFTAAHTALYRHSRVAHRIGEAPILLLTTTGRRSGKRRTVPVMYVPGDEPILVASNGGSPGHPSWFLNLRANPDASVERDGELFDVTARVVHGNERSRLWRRAIAVYPPYADYQRRTDRRLPMIVLHRK